MEPWMKLLQMHCDATSITAVAQELGVSRTTVSLVLSGKYPGKTDNMAARVMDTLNRVRCPYSGGMVKPSFCQNMGDKIPTSSPGALRWWRQCQTCEHNPNKGGGDD